MSVANNQSVRSDILDGVVALLGDSASRTRFRSFAVKELPAENVLPDEDDPAYDTAGQVDRTFRFTVRHLVAAADGAEKLADQRYCRTSSLLLADLTLGGLVKTIREVKTRWDAEDGELQQMALVSTFEVLFSTSRRDPRVPGF